MIEKEVLEAFPREKFTTAGKTWAGDVFYSDIYSYLVRKVGKNKVKSYYSDVCNILRKNSYYIHS